MSAESSVEAPPPLDDVDVVVVDEEPQPGRPINIVRAPNIRAAESNRVFFIDGKIEITPFGFDRTNRTYHLEYGESMTVFRTDWVIAKGEEIR